MMIERIRKKKNKVGYSSSIQSNQQVLEDKGNNQYIFADGSSKYGREQSIPKNQMFFQKENGRE
jgi:hypothetical protein